MNSSSPLVIGIDFGGTSVKIGVIRGTEILDQAPSIPTQEFSSALSLIHAMEKSIAELRLKHPNIAAIGIGMPGVVNFSTGNIAELANVPGWEKFPIRDTLAASTHLPVVADNDAKCMTYAEWKLGAAQGLEDAICVTLGTGVGGGIIANGKLVRGASFGAGHIGQMSIHYQGVSGAHHNLGELESYIGNREFIHHAQELYQKHQVAIPAELSPAKLTDLAKQGDPVALEVWDDYAAKLACALMSCVYLLNPAKIVLGGGMASAGEVLFTPLKRHLFAQIPWQFGDALEIVPAHFGPEAGILGAAALAADLVQK